MKLHLSNYGRLANFENFLRLFDPSEPLRLQISMDPKSVRLHPAAVAFAACVADLVSRNNGIHTGQAPDVRPLPHLMRMGLFNYLKLPHYRDATRHHHSGRFIPLHRLADERHLSDFIQDTVPLLHATPREMEPIKYVISELGRNVLEHARSPTGAFVCAQYDIRSHLLSIGIADSGIGIRKSMNQAYRPGSDWDAICLALKPGVTGTTRRLAGNDYNAGAGMFFAKSIACASRCFFVVYSGDAMYKLKPPAKEKALSLHGDPLQDSHTKVIGLPHWSGTVIGIDLGIKQEVPFERLMDMIRDAFRNDVKARRKEKFKKPRFI